MAWPNWLGRNGFPTSRVASDSPGTIPLDPLILRCHAESHPFFWGLAVDFWTTYQDVRERNEETERDKKIKQKACRIFHGSNGMVVEDLKGKNCNTQLL